MSLQAKRAHPFSYRLIFDDPYVGFRTELLQADSAANIQDLYWRNLRSLTVLPDALPPQLRGIKNRQLRVEFQGYLQQASDFWVASSVTPSPSSALPLYYCFLQLTKAEVLLSAPSKVLGMTPGHGLGTRNLKAKEARAVREEVAKKGVFVELAKARTGQPPVAGEQWTLAELMSAVSDSRYELEQAGRAKNYSCQLTAHVVADETEAWIVLDVGDDPAVVSSSRCRAQLAKYGFRLRKASQPLDRPGSTSSQVRYCLESERELRASGGNIGHEEALSIKAKYLSPLLPILGVAPFGQTELSLMPSDGTPLSPPLARLAALHLLSSLVRYRPGLLVDEAERWLAEAFLADSITPLLQAAFMHMSSKLLVFSR